MARASNKEPVETAGENFRFSDPETAGAGQSGGMVDKLADWTASAPLLGQLGDFSLTLALRWLLWLLAVLLCLAGMIAVLGGAGLGYMAIGTLSNSIVQPLDAASLAMGDASNSISSYGLMAANVSNATGTMAGSMRNLSEGLNGSAATLQSLVTVPIIGSQLGGLSTAAGQLQQSSSGLDAAAGQLDAAGKAGGDATATLQTVAGDLADMGNKLQTSRQMVVSGMAGLQVAVLAAGAGLELLLGSTLCLALAYGPPRSERKK